MILRTEYLILFKIQAWKNLTDQRKNKGQHAKGTDIKKHMYDVFRLAEVLTGEEEVQIPQNIMSCISQFLSEMKDIKDLDNRLKQIGVSVEKDDVLEILKKIYRTEMR